MDLVIDTSGVIRAVYAEAIDLASLGRPAIARAGRVEPDAAGLWHADLGPVLGPFDLRSDALAVEVAWLETHWPTRPV